MKPRPRSSPPSTSVVDDDAHGFRARARPRPSSLFSLSDDILCAIVARLGARDAVALEGSCRAARALFARGGGALWGALWEAWRRRHRPPEAGLASLAAAPRSASDLVRVAARRGCDRRGCVRQGHPRWAIGARLCDGCFHLLTVSDLTLSVEMHAPTARWARLPHEHAHPSRPSRAPALRLFLASDVAAAVGPPPESAQHARGAARARRRREVARMRRERAAEVAAAVGEPPGGSEPTRAEAVALSEWGYRRTEAEEAPLWDAVRRDRERSEGLAARRAALSEALEGLGLDAERAIAASKTARAALRYGRAASDAVLARILGEASGA